MDVDRPPTATTPFADTRDAAAAWMAPALASTKQPRHRNHDYDDDDADADDDDDEFGDAADAEHRAGLAVDWFVSRLKGGGGCGGGGGSAATTTVTVPELVRGPLGPFLTHREQDVRARSVLLLALLLERADSKGAAEKGTTGRGGNDDNDTPPLLQPASRNTSSGLST